jgi:thiamine-phosphate pyrophosphorylase
MMTGIEKQIARLHYLTQDNVPGMSHAQLAESACSAGLRWVQLRAKGADETEWQRIAEETKKITDCFRAKLIINDNPQLALKIQAHGVHLGKNDIPPAEARAMLGSDAIIGGTANNMEDLKRLVKEDIDYIGIGPFRFTTTKQQLSPVLSKEELHELIRYQKDIPVVVIGGILATDVKEILEAGAHGVAVSSAINLGADRIAAARQFMTHFI